MSAPIRTVRCVRSALAWLLGVAASAGALAGPATDHPPDTTRQQQLIHVVRQDCGSCHGMLLTGGLGPALTREALAGLPAEAIAATIFHGRPGTPMPGWRAMLTESEASWIAEQLLAGFPAEPRR